MYNPHQQLPSGDVPQRGYPQPSGGYPQPCVDGYPQPGFVQSPQPTGSGAYGTVYYDPETCGQAGEIKGFDFNDESIRKGFVRKVYSILMCQLLVTFVITALFVFHMPIKNWVYQHGYLVLVAWIVAMVITIAISYCESVRRKSPMNFICLGIFTLAESFLFGVLSSFYDTDIVLIAVGITVVVCLALTLFAFQTKWNFTPWRCIYIAGLITVPSFCIIAICSPYNKILLVLATILVIIFSFFLVYDTQLMIGGKHKYSLSPEEYIFAALNLYLDIICIYRSIMSIMGFARN